MRARLLRLTGLCLLMGACTEGAVSPPEPPTATLEFARLEAETVARGFAGALNDQVELRRSLLLALRASGLMDHKITLQEYARTPEGTALVTEAARSLGTTYELL